MASNRIRPYILNHSNTTDINDHALTPNAFKGYYTASELVSIYNFPKPTDIPYVAAVISFGGGIFGTIDSEGVVTNSDCQAYWNFIGIPPANHPTVIVRTILGARNLPSDTDGGSTMENLLDIETLGGVCATSKLTIILYIAPNPASFTSVFSYVYNTPIKVKGVSYKPNIISCSWGMSEIYVDSVELKKTNELFKKITDSGVNICVATGDYGSNNGVGGKGNYVDFPASSPYVTAVGGTTLTCPNYKYDSYTKEIGWSYGGGGISIKFPKPSYQTIVSATGRSVPDISSCADPDTGVMFMINGKKYILGGTSVAAPTIAGCLAAKNTRKFINPILYTSNPDCYHDVTVGSNGGYKAKLGYDQCTGLGSINGTFLKIVSSKKTPFLNYNVDVKSVIVSPNNYYININKQLQLTAYVAPHNSKSLGVVWKSSNTNASVTTTGLVSAIKSGTVTITATSVSNNNCVGICTITIL